MYFMETGEVFVPVYEESRTKQSFKDQTDINKLIQRAQVTGSIAHLEKHDKAIYGEFDGYDMHQALQKLELAQEIFDDLPSELRREFQTPIAFL